MDREAQQKATTTDQNMQRGQYQDSLENGDPQDYLFTLDWATKHTHTTPWYLHSNLKEVSLELQSGDGVLLLRKGGEDGGGTVDLVTCVLGINSLVPSLTLVAQEHHQRAGKTMLMFLSASTFCNNSTQIILIYLYCWLNVIDKSSSIETGNGGMTKLFSSSPMYSFSNYWLSN